MRTEVIDSGDGLMKPQFPIQIGNRANQMAVPHVFAPIIVIVYNGTIVPVKVSEVTYVSYLSVLRARKPQS